MQLQLLLRTNVVIDGCKTYEQRFFSVRTVPQKIPISSFPNLMPKGTKELRGFRVRYPTTYW